MNYLEIVQLAFIQNPIKTIIYSLPAIFLFLLGIGNMIISCTSNFRNEPFTDMFDFLLKAGNGLGLFIMGFIVFVIGFICLPKFDWVDLDSTYATKFVEEAYTENVEKFNKQDNPVYSLLESQEREMRNFKKEMQKQNPTKNFMFSNNVESILATKKPLLLKCIEDNKNAYLIKLKSNILTKKDVKEDIEKFGPDCAVKIVKN